MRAMSEKPSSSSPSFADWQKLPPAEQARAWEKIRPGTFDQIWREAQTEGSHRRQLEIDLARHQRRMAWFIQVLQLLRILGAFAALTVLAFVSLYFVNHHAPTQGASIFTVGGISAVGLFLGLNPSRFATSAKRDTQQALGQAIQGGEAGGSIETTSPGRY